MSDAVIERPASWRPASYSSEAEETIEAIHQGNVDAIVVHGPDGPQIIMLHGGSDPYRVLVERMSDGALTLDDQDTILYANGRLTDLTGFLPQQLVGKEFGRLFDGEVPQNDDNTPREAMLKQRENGGIPVSVWMSPIALGGIAAKLVTITDLSIHRRAEEVASSERFARSILEQATDAVVVLTPDGRILNVSLIAEQLAVKSPIGLMFSEAFPLEASSSTQAGLLARFSRESLDAALATKPFHGVEVKLRDPQFAKRSFLLSAGPLLNDAKDSIGSIVTLTEITERKRAEEQQTMLVAELNHRVKNILAIVQSVALQTVRNSQSLETFNAAFSGRLKALSIAHDILTQTRWIGIGLNELLAAVLAPYRGTGETQILLEGPPVLLPARAVLPLSMAVHELATNASKYGALSTPQGRVKVTWTVSQAEPPQVSMAWTEQAGPKVKSAAGRGFGTTLINRVVGFDLDGRAEVSFPPEGAQAVIAFPLKAETTPEILPGSATQPH